MNAESSPKRVRWAPSLLVLLALIGAFFLGSKFSYIPTGSVGSSTEVPGHEWWYPGNGPTVWLSREGVFVWNREMPRSLSDLPARIQEFRKKSQTNVVNISSEELTRFEDVVFAVSQFRKSGFDHLTLNTKPAPTAELARE